MITSIFIEANRSRCKGYKQTNHGNGDGTPAEEISLLFELSGIL
jgi:hypothetical protein